MKNLQKLFNRKMDRKEFLVYLGLFLLTITGISGTIKNLSSLEMSNKNEKKPIKGFGAGPYGM